MPAPRPIFSVSFDAVALAAATAKSVCELKPPATTGAVILGWWLEFDGVTPANTPVKVEVGRFSAAVTTISAFTPMKVNHGNISLASACVAGTNASVEGAGTATDVEFHRVPPTSGLPWMESLGTEWVLGASTFWRIRCTAAQIVNVTGGFRYTE